VNGFLLDTNIPSELTNPYPEARVADWLDSASESDLFLCAVTIGELRKGINVLADGQRRRRLDTWLTQDLIPNFKDRILPVTASIANLWGVLDATRQLQGIPLNVADGLIAATALEHNLTLVTRNVKDFVHLNVSLFNPWE